MLETSSRTTKTTRKEIHLRDYLIVLDRHKWLIVAAVLVTFLSTVLYLRRQVPVYEAHASIIIEPRRAREMVFAQSVQAISLDLETQIEVIKTTPVLASVVKQLDLAASPEGTPGFSDAVKGLKKNVKIGFVKNTKMVTITAKHPVPEKAQAIADVVAQAYIDQDRLSRLQSGRDSVRWLSVQLADLKTKLKDSEEAFQKFKEREGMITLDDMRDEDLEEISKLNAIYTSARAKRLELESIIDGIGSESSVNLNIPIGLLDSPTLQSLGTELGQLQTELADKKKVFKDTYPGVIELKDRIQLTGQKILAELRRQKDFMKVQEDLFFKQQESKREEALKLSEKELEYLSLEREVTTNREMYNTLLTKVKELSLAGEADLNNIRIVEPAELPILPVGNKRLTLILSGVLGLSLGIGFAFFLEYLENTIRTPEDVEQHLGLPVLGIVPQIAEAKDSKSPPIIVQGSSKSAPAESYRSMRTNILFAGKEDSVKTVVITSAGPKEGKSLTTANLGVVLAQAGHNVLLVDADLRRPMLHRVFGADKYKGLSTVLAEELTIDEAIVKTDIPNLSVLTAGASSTNPSEILGSAQMKDVLEFVREQYDVVLLDSAPILGMADAAVLAAESDAVILVVKTGEATRKVLKTALMQLEQVEAQIFGVVLNNVDIRRDRYYYYYYYYYYYSPYEDEDGKKVRKRKKHSGRKRTRRTAFKV